MKKFLTAFVAMLTVIAMCVIIAGCAPSVSGKTYKFDKVEANYDEGELSVAQKAAAKIAIGVVELAVSGTEYEFSAEDDTVKFKGVTYGTYKQDGSKVTISVASASVVEAEVSGKTLKIGTTEDGFKFYLIYVQA